MHVAFIMITAQTGMPFSVAEKVSEIENVKFAYPVTGVYDIIAYVEAEKELSDELKRIVNEIHAIDGVLETMTSIAVH